jgi:hypothetical protein
LLANGSCSCHAELRQRDAGTSLVSQASGLGCDERIVAGQVSRIHGLQSAFGQSQNEVCIRAELGRHRLQRGRKSRDESDLSGLLQGFGHHGLVGPKHRDVGMPRRDRSDAGAECRTGEENSLGARAHGIVGQDLEAPVHGRVQPVAASCQVCRQAVVKQVHAHGLRPVSLECVVDGPDRVAQGVNEGNPCHVWEPGS